MILFTSILALGTSLKGFFVVIVVKDGRIKNYFDFFLSKPNFL